MDREPQWSGESEHFPRLPTLNISDDQKGHALLVLLGGVSVRQETGPGQREAVVVGLWTETHCGSGGSRHFPSLPAPINRIDDHTSARCIICL